MLFLVGNSETGSKDIRRQLANDIRLLTTTGMHNRRITAEAAVA
jgi:hypothetical protein